MQARQISLGDERRSSRVSHALHRVWNFPPNWTKITPNPVVQRTTARTNAVLRAPYAHLSPPR